MEDQTEKNETPCSYCKTHLPHEIMTKLESGAFRSLCDHLRERSDTVQNIDLMTVSGFCRNCLAKWLVVEARKISDEMKNFELSDEQKQIAQALDALGYDEAAEEVYGCTYPEWKKRHAKKASEKILQAYEASKPIWAQHDKSLLQTRAEKTQPSSTHPPSQPTTTAAPSSSLLSDVCCQPVDKTALPPATETQPTFIAPPPPSTQLNLRVGILTVSDRASANLYETGDLSGPAVESSLIQILRDLNSKYAPDGNDPLVRYTISQKQIVPDEPSAISQTLTQWAQTCNLIVTSGGTGFAPRDVTPEATLAVLEQECRGLMPWASSQCALFGNQPLSALSRGVAGVCGKSVIVNLPGNPKGVEQMMDILVPLLLHAVKDLERN